MERVRANIPFDYITIKVTKSRIDKGLLAIPVSAIHMFPEDAEEVRVVDMDGVEETSSFTPYKSSSRECRIGGMRSFYEKYRVQSGDELVVQPLGDNRFRILPERLFEERVTEYERELERAEDERRVEKVVEEFSRLVNESPDRLLTAEYVRLAAESPVRRKTHIRKESRKKESVPASLRRILLAVYGGHCQISGFTFITRAGKPYFEIHHINPDYGNYVKNLLVVSPNVHAQFTYAKVEHFFDDGGWLRRVKFNGEEHRVFQAVDRLPKVYVKEVHQM